MYDEANKEICDKDGNADLRVFWKLEPAFVDIAFSCEILLKIFLREIKAVWHRDIDYIMIYIKNCQIVRKR